MTLETPWNRARKKRHLLQENSLSKLEGGQKTPGSGRIWRFKRDGRFGFFLVEARTTDADSYRIDRREFLKIRQEGMQTPGGALPAMQIDIKELRLFVAELSVIEEMQTRLFELEAEVAARDDADKTSLP